MEMGEGAGWRPQIFWPGWICAVRSKPSDAKNSKK